MTPIRTVTVALACALAALAGGLWLGGHPESLPGFVRDAFVDDDRALRAEIIETIQDNYYKPVDSEALDEASLRAIVRSLHDPFSHYISAKDAKRFQESIDGSFSGVGLSVDHDRRGLRVLNVFDGTPADRAGIRKGEVITAVDGRPLAGLGSDVGARSRKRPATHADSRAPPDRGSGCPEPRGEARRAQARRRAAAVLLERRPRPSAPRDRPGPCSRGRGAGARPARERRGAAPRGRARVERLPG
jgi:hypothetical protein